MEARLEVLAEVHASRCHDPSEIPQTHHLLNNQLMEVVDDNIEVSPTLIYDGLQHGLIGLIAGCDDCGGQIVSPNSFARDIVLRVV